MKKSAEQFSFKNIVKLLIFPFLVYVLNNIFESVAPEFYKLRSIDTYSHFLGGLSIAYSAYFAMFLLEEKNWLVIKKDILRAFIALATVMTAAVFWEFYEFIYIYSWGASIHASVFDIIKDLYMGMFGAVVFYFGKQFLADPRVILRGAKK